MSIKQCCVCSREFDYGITKGGQELFGRTKYKYVCQECCNKLGIKKGIIGAFKASTMDAKKIIKKIYEIEPSESLQKQYEIVTKAIDEESTEMKEDFNKIRAQIEVSTKKTINKVELKKVGDRIGVGIKKTINEISKHSDCKQKKEEKFTCTQCGHVYFVSDSDELKNIINMLNCSVYSLNRLKNFSQCPRCHSTQTKHETVTFWVDKKGNIVE